MTTERKEEILWAMINFIEDSPVWIECLDGWVNNLSSEEWKEFKSEIIVE